MATCKAQVEGARRLARRRLNARGDWQGAGGGRGAGGKAQMEGAVMAARRSLRWRALCWRQVADGGRGEGGKAQEEGDVLAASLGWMHWRALGCCSAHGLKTS